MRRMNQPTGTLPHREKQLPRDGPVGRSHGARLASHSKQKVSVGALIGSKRLGIIRETVKTTLFQKSM